MQKQSKQACVLEMSIIIFFFFLKDKLILFHFVTDLPCIPHSCSNNLKNKTKRKTNERKKKQKKKTKAMTELKRLGQTSKDHGCFLADVPQNTEDESRWHLSANITWLLAALICFQFAIIAFLLFCPAPSVLSNESNNDVSKSHLPSSVHDDDVQISPPRHRKNASPSSASPRISTPELGFHPQDELPMFHPSCEEGDLIVATTEGPPYVYSEPDAAGNLTWKGYSVDLLDDMMRHLQLTYCFNKTDSYGTLMDDGRWNGIMEEVRTGRADIGLQKLTVTRARAKVVLFTSPFINSAFTAIMRREPMYDFFEYLQAFDWGLLALIVGAVFFTSVSLYVLMQLQRRLVAALFFILRHQKFTFPQARE